VSCADRADTQARLFCFPHSGAGASTFANWPASLPSTVEVLGVELPGRGVRLLEPPRSDLAGMVGEIADQIGELDDVPFAFFGHSVGTLLAYEVAKELGRRNEILPETMIVSAGRAPNGESQPLLKPGITDEEILEMVIGMGGISAELAAHTDLLELWIPALRADLTMLDAYRYVEQDELPMPIVLFAGLHDDVVTMDAMEPWAELTEAGTSWEMFPGGHFYLADNAHPQVMAALTRHLSPLLRRKAA
jgi:surfactin synthase thioesterase subunit